MNRPRLTDGLAKHVGDLKDKDANRVLVIGDLHEPFCLEEYLDHCVMVYEKYNCNRVVFIGDVIDSHYSSFHDTDPDGLGGGDELDLAIRKLSRWVRHFPNADVTIGNHGRIVARKAFSASIPKAWIRSMNEVLGAPGWRFVDSVVIDDVLYIHGDGAGQARSRMRKELHSIVQGHFHTVAYIDWAVGRTFRIFGMQVGCGVDKDAYALAYAKNHPKPVIACGVVLNNGTLPIIEPMHL